jgi:bla regulator protein blaR1
MMLPWIAYALLTAAAFAALGALLERVLGGRWIARRFIWLGAMMTTAATPVIFSALAAPRVNTISMTASAIVGIAVPAPTRMSTDRLIALAWAAASAAIVLCLVASHMRLRRRLRDCRRANVAAGSVIVSDDFGPAVVGVIRPDIVLPVWSLALSDVDLNLVVAHEREHIRAHDPALHAATLILAVALPWNAALWWQLKRLRLAIEIDCDARVVRGGHDPLRYGELLVAAHANVTRRISPVLALAQHRSALGRRIDALVQSPRRSLSRMIVAVGTTSALVAAVAAAPAPPLRERTQIVASGRVTATPPTLARDAARAPAGAVVRRAAPARRRVADVALPPASVIPAGSVDMPRPTAAPTPVIRLRNGGRGGAGGFMRPSSPGFVAAGPLSTRPDSGARAGGVVRASAIRRDSTPP